MAESNTNHLKIYEDKPSQASPVGTAGIGSLPGVLRAFRKATGYTLRCRPQIDPSQMVDLTWSTPVNPGDGLTPGHLSLEPAMETKTSPNKPAVPVEVVREFASSLGGMIEELLRTQHTLWQREAELAGGVSQVPRGNDKTNLAGRLHSILQGGAHSVGCHSAALYLLDDATSQLKLRSSWGLPADRMTDPPRRLQCAMADLEAMLGHAVVLDDESLAEYWNPPEHFASTVCVPVSSPTTILGTLWFFSNEARDFSDQETSIVEMVAGRIAADLEREMLLREGVDGAELKGQLAAAERMQRNQLPSIAPLLDGWDIAGWAKQAKGVGGDFFDWFSLSDGMVAVAVGDVMDQGVEAAISTSSVKAAIRSHGQYQRKAAQLLEHVNLTMWTASAGDLFASMFCGMIDTAAGKVHYARAGRPTVIRVRPERWDSLGQPTQLLGQSPESSYVDEVCHLRPGEALVVFTDGFRDAIDGQGTPLGEEAIAKRMASMLALGAKDLVSAAKHCLEEHTQGPLADDCTILVIKRTTA